MTRILPTTFLALAVLLAACSTPVDIRNAAPRVTHVTSVTPTADGLLVVYWIQDHEEDPVDITAAYAVGSGACASLRQQLATAMDEGEPLVPSEAGMTDVVDVAGVGHHFSGLSSGASFPGQAHELMWDASALASGDEVCLYLLPDDRNGEFGDPVLTPTFTVSEGYAPLPLPEEDVVEEDTTTAEDVSAPTDV